MRSREWAARAAGPTLRMGTVMADDPMRSAPLSAVYWDPQQRAREAVLDLPDSGEVGELRREWLAALDRGEFEVRTEQAAGHHPGVMAVQVYVQGHLVVSLILQQAPRQSPN
jgi:hypothetical protein